MNVNGVELIPETERIYLIKNYPGWSIWKVHEGSYILLTPRATRYSWSNSLIDCTHEFRVMMREMVEKVEQERYNTRT